MKLAKILFLTTCIFFLAIMAIAQPPTNTIDSIPAYAGPSLPSAGEFKPTSLALPAQPVIPTIVPTARRQAAVSPAIVPLIPTSLPMPDVLALAQPSLDEFIANLPGGKSGQVVGVYAPGVMALVVEPQPPGHGLYVTEKMGFATLFNRPLHFNVTALLAHNTHSGILFYELDLGEEVTLVYGDGRTAVYQIEMIEDFQKLQPGNPRSDYVALASGTVMTTSDVFTRFYRNGPHLVLQTCLEYEGDYNWGVRFIVGEGIRD
ncbi:MAG TPA: hypothetical protein VLH85_05275 [Levilinea sp.]|nr:hypothetical protein [Levilinea sp.]